MKYVRQVLAVCAFVGSMGAAAPLMAADAPKPVEVKKDLILKGDAKCTGCHDEADDPVPSMLDLHPSVLAIGKTKHGAVADGRTPTCTDCHGESEKHVNYAGKDKPPKSDRVFSKKTTTPVAERNQACLACHQGGNRIAWQSSTHATRDVACTSCHNIHAKRDKVRDKVTQTETCYTCHKEQRAQMNRVSHHPVPEGKMSCSSCHNVHGDNPKQLLKATTNETCYTCHMEKRGPFVHNHQPVSEDCAICHQPHGTTVANLLKSRAPFLCQECHSHPSHPGQTPGQPSARTTSTSMLGAIGRGCLNCHVNIHGSNSSQNSATVGRFRR
ncbi:MAG: DmsE family decaheme c-type cytochrome [Gammaproteobacteria bacterium]|nr:DmsE family decaheme c-type cytochrome [Gammaproteobacteria bacterium]MBU1979868.1 DmsE family decaheme c-type cytochrome [Gammaproteobacteria bacterium]